MGAAGGPNIATDGLVFGYDLGNTLRSYPGMPAVNCARVPTTSGNGNTTGNWTVTEITDGTVTPPREGARVFKFVAGTTSNLYRQSGYYYGGGFTANNTGNNLILGRTSPSNFTTVSEANKYRWGFWVRGDVANNAGWGFSIDIGDRGGASYTVGNKTDWYFISCVNDLGIASTSYPYDFFDIFSSNQGLTLYIADMGIMRAPGTVDNLPVLQAWPQWIDYGQERRHVEGLRDMVGTTPIDLANVSFDSDAQITFDGTDDDINIGTATSTSFQRTIEMVFRTNTLGYLYPLAAYTRGGGQSVVAGKRMWLGFQSNKFQMHGWGTSDPASTTTIQTGQYYHAVYAYDQDTKKHYIWINGVLENNSTNDQGGFTSWNNSSDHNWFVGGDPDCANWNASAGRSLNGDIPIFKVYDRILSDDEVARNFQGVRKRFGI